MVQAASVQVEAPAPATPPLGEVTCRPTFELPKPGVTFLVGGLTAAVLEVAVNRRNGGGGWSMAKLPLCEMRRGGLAFFPVKSSSDLRRQFEAAMAYPIEAVPYHPHQRCVFPLPLVRFLEAGLDDFGLSNSEFIRRSSSVRPSDCQEGPVKAVVLDHFSEYLRFGDTGQTIRVSSVPLTLCKSSRSNTVRR